MTRTMTLKTARMLLHFAKALPILKPRARSKAARAARAWLAAGYVPTTNVARPGAEQVRWADVRVALFTLAMADQSAFFVARVA